MQTEPSAAAERRLRGKEREGGVKKEREVTEEGVVVEGAKGGGGRNVVYVNGIVGRTGCGGWASGSGCGDGGEVGREPAIKLMVVSEAECLKSRVFDFGF
ncbi:hypothetical protein GH714_005631 [Hevea brasiliensis]|uniref:Uncharacterized protein n=1 Tax=Hevea brasiliensis TaxID=3981 RepID=A0A6A6LVJ4_HEVBR|nr:hypothetical protein GH714_005631 [Hevea brasiliensis]